MLYHLGLSAILFAMVVLGLQATARAEIGAIFLLTLLPTVFAMVLLPILLYRAYALWTATYTIERDGLRLQWGLRVEEIPMKAIRWVSPSRSYAGPLPLPWPRLDGAVLGVRQLQKEQTIEFLSASSQGLILIGTDERVFAISPLRTDEFLSAYRHETELGSFADRPARSVRPAAILSNFWPDTRARSLVLGLFALNLALLLWVSLSIPAHPTIPFRFSAAGNPTEFAPGVRLLLLPVISILIGTVDFLLGLFFYRRVETQIVAYMLWATGLATSVLFLGAVYFILRSS